MEASSPTQCSRMAKGRSGSNAGIHFAKFAHANMKTLCLLAICQAQQAVNKAGALRLQEESVGFISLTSLRLSQK